MSKTPGMATVVSDGFSVSTNKGTTEDLEANLKSEAAPLDGAPEDPKEAEARETKAAAAKLGKKGGEAAARVRAKADKEPDDLEADGEPKPKEAKAEPEDKEPDIPKDRSEAEKRRHDPAVRLAQLAREKNDAKREAEEARAEVAKLKAERAAPAKPEVEKEPEKAAAPKKPTPDDYGTYEDYVEALADFKADERIRKMRQEDESQQKADRAVEDIKKRGNTFRERVFAADASVQERLAKPEALAFMKELQPSWAVPPGTAMRAINDISDAIIYSEHAPQLLLYLAENPDALDKLQGLPDPPAVHRAMGRLEAAVSHEAAPAPDAVPKPVVAYSQAKSPVRPISGTPAAVEDDPDAEDDFDAYKRKADARDSRLRRRA